MTENLTEFYQAGYQAYVPGSKVSHPEAPSCYDSDEKMEWERGYWDARFKDDKHDGTDWS